MYVRIKWGFPGGSVVKNPPANARRQRRRRFDPWVGKIPGGRHDNPLQYSCLENPKDRGAWWAIVHGVAKSQTRLSMPSLKNKAHYERHLGTVIEGMACVVTDWVQIPASPRVDYLLKKCLTSW